MKIIFYCESCEHQFTDEQREFYLENGSYQCHYCKTYHALAMVIVVKEKVD